MALARQERRRSREIIVLLTILAVVAAGSALRTMYVVTMPLVAGFFLAVLVYPMERRVRLRLPRKLGFLGVVLSAVVVMLVPAISFVLFWISGRLVGSKVPEYTKRFQDLWSRLSTWAQAHNVPMQESVREGINQVIGVAGTVLTSAWSLLGLLGLLGIIFFLAILMLLEVPNWQEKLYKSFGQRQAETMSGTVAAISQKIRDYMVLHTVVSAMSALAEGVWIWVLGVDFAFLWAIIIFALNYIPRVGSVISFIPPTVVALIQVGFGWSMLVLAGLVVIDTVIGYLVEPRMGARALSVSPVVMLLSVMVWGWLWGVAGAILAVPMTVAVIVIFANIPSTRPLAMLLGQFPDEKTLTEETSPRRREPDEAEGPQEE